MFENGYIKLSRSIMKWEWYKNQNTKALFLHCVLKANFAPQRFEGVEIKRGEFVTSLSSLSKETGLTISELRTAMEHLVLTGELARRKVSKFTVITVLSYDLYQDSSQGFSQTIRKPFANDSQTIRNNIRNKRIYKNDKKEREDVLTLGEYKNVFFTQMEFDKLVDEFGEELAQAKIESLSEYMLTSGKDYENHYAKVRSFCKQDEEKWRAEKEKADDDDPSYDLSRFEEMALKNTPGVNK